MLTTVHGSQPALQLSEKRVLMISDEEVEIQVRAATGWDQNWVFWADGQFSSVYALTSTDVTSIAMPLNPSWDAHLVYAFPLGQWEEVPGDAGLDLYRNIVEIYLSVAIDAEWDAPIHAREAYGDDGTLSNWVLTGLRRGTNVNRVDGVPTQGRMEIVLTTDVGVHTLDLYVSEIIVASGYRTGDGSITLTERNGSGISGTVDLAYSADIDADDGAYVLFAWPETYTLAEGDVTLATVGDDGYANRFAAHIDTSGGEPLASGTHSVKMKITSDVGVEGAFGTPVDIVLAYRTPSPSAPAYLDGGYLNTRITFTTATPAWVAETAKAIRDWVVPSTGPAGYAYECTASGTTDEDEPIWPTVLGATVVDGDVTWTCRPEVTYRVYDSELDGPVNYAGTPTTAAASGGTVTVTLPVGVEVAGVRKPHIAAVCNGVEDLDGLTVEIEYDADGVVVEPGPNYPTVQIDSILGRVLTLAYRYDPGWDSVAPATVNAWLVREPGEGASPDWSSPDVTQAIDGDDDFGVRTGTIVLTAPSDGHYRWVVRLADAAGNLSGNTDLIGPRWLGTTVPAAPSMTLTASA